MPTELRLQMDFIQMGFILSCFKIIITEMAEAIS